MIKTIITFFLLALLASCTNQNVYNLTEQKLHVDGVSQPVIKLNGTWQINLTPSEKIWQQGEVSQSSNQNWHNIQVPGEAHMQGFAIKHDIPFAYQTSFTVPADYINKRVELQFDGVYSYAKVWVNGQYICDHSGGFTRWSCDISNAVTPGKEAQLQMEVTDKGDEISFASGYAKHQVGGILRDVSLVATPVNYPKKVIIETNLDDNYMHASLNVSGSTLQKTVNGKLNLTLVDATNTVVVLQNNELVLNDELNFNIKNAIKAPKKWDAEHPNLYYLTLSYSEDNKNVWKKTYPVGFREVKIAGNKLLVNGKPVKLRGANRHDVHPLLGRVSTPEYDLKDVLLAKEANMNFIRTSHYPPTEYFLQLADKYGLYIEDETAICFSGEPSNPNNSGNKPEYTAHYLSQLEEMVNNHRNHPSIIIWSIGNENLYGFNFKKSYDWVKANDTTRPVIYSFPGLVPKELKAYDLMSIHYPGVDEPKEERGITITDFTYDDMPVLFDEWAHVPAYNTVTLAEDPNIRDFWGLSLDIMWQKTFDSDGGLGGGIWGMIDETFMLPDMKHLTKDASSKPEDIGKKSVGYGEWGIIDPWRRKKPEFWNTKKSYTPVKLLTTEISNYSAGAAIKLPLYNRFDHTNINELRLTVRYKNDVKQVKLPSIEPHAKGELSIELQQWDWDKNEALTLDFFDQNNQLIDTYNVRQSPQQKITKAATSAEKVNLQDTEKQLNIVTENGTHIIVNKTTGLLSAIERDGKNTKLMGPYVNLRTIGEKVAFTSHAINDHANQWTLTSFKHELINNKVVLTTKGQYRNDEKASSVEFVINIDGSGAVDVNYTLNNIPDEYIREIGLKFMLDDEFDRLSWSRDAYWSAYPEGHLSAASGNVALYGTKATAYRSKPNKPWTEDLKSFRIEGVEDENISALSFISKATKEHVTEYSLQQNGHKTISLVGKGDAYGRIAKSDSGLSLFTSNEIDYIDIAWGNYQHNIKRKGQYSNSISLKVNGESLKP